MLMAESPSLPTKRDTNTPSTAVYSDDTTSMATAGTEKASSCQKLNSCEIARFILHSLICDGHYCKLWCNPRVKRLLRSFTAPASGRKSHEKLL